jgi:transcriptional regulator with XRE-family HTH domain
LRRIVVNMGTNAVQRDATAETVSANVKRLRKGQNLGLRSLSNKLGEVGRPLGHSAVDQIEKGTRRVDVDDLMALAAALGVSPITLLMPPMSGEGTNQMADSDEMVQVARKVDPVPAGRLWLWLRADSPLPGYKGSHRKFFVDARPDWDAGPGDPRFWTKDAVDGDD